MGSTEGGQKVVKGDLVRQIFDAQPGGVTGAMLAMEKVIRADGEVEEAAGFDAIGMVIVILGSGLRQLQQGGAADAVACSDGSGVRGRDAVAGEADIDLLRGSESERGVDVG